MVQHWVQVTKDCLTLEREDIGFEYCWQKIILCNSLVTMDWPQKLDSPLMIMLKFTTPGTGCHR